MLRVVPAFDACGPGRLIRVVPAFDTCGPGRLIRVVPAKKAKVLLSPNSGIFTLKGPHLCVRGGLGGPGGTFSPVMAEICLKTPITNAQPIDLNSNDVY